MILILLIIFPLRAESQEPKQLNIIWHSGALGNLLNEMGKKYTKQTGVVINVELVPWAEWHDTIVADLESQQGKYDLLIFDSQSMSEFASNNSVVLLNPYLEHAKHLNVTDYDPQALATYAEYPEGSSRYHALPINQDVMGLVYRKDLFEDVREKEKFKNTYGYKLEVPHTYDQLKDIVEFFTRPEANLYGIALYGSQQYDAVSSVFNNVLWSFGGKLWNPTENRAAGVINSPKAVAALEYFKKLFDYTPPGATDWYYDEVNEAIKAGNVAIGINWYYFFNTYLDPKNSKVSTTIGFASLPGQQDSKGAFQQYHSVGGQGISISKHARNPGEAWKFLEWLMSYERQWEWVRGGGQTGRMDILQSSDYGEAAPYNAAFPLSMSRVKDYWHLVEYPQLLAIYQKQLHRAIRNSITAKDALDKVARQQQRVFDDKKSQ